MTRKYSVIFLLAFSCGMAPAQTAPAQDAATVIGAGVAAMGIRNLSSVGSYSYSGTGVSYQPGAAKTPNGALPARTLSKYTRVIDFDAGGSWEESIGAAGDTPEIRRIPFHEQYGLVGKQFDIWMTPVGFLKTALTHDAKVKPATVGGKPFTAVSFVSDKKYTITGYFNNEHLLERVEARVDDPVLGDILVESIYSDYKDLGYGLVFPTRVVKKEGGTVVLDLTVNKAVRNTVKFVGEILYSTVNDGQLIEFRGALKGEAPPIPVDQVLHGDSVYDFSVKNVNGEVYHSLFMEFNDYLVAIEAPLDEDDAKAVIAEAHQVFGSKPIRYVVNTHAHFPEIGGLRTYAAEGAIIITQQANKAYLEKILAQPHTIHPDELSQTKKKIVIEAVAEKRVLTDGKHVLELHHVPNGHADGMLIAYVPSEQLVAQTELYVVRQQKIDITTDGHAIPQPNPPDIRYAADLVSSLDRLKIDYQTVVCLQGREASKSELLKDIKNTGASAASLR